MSIHPTAIVAEGAVIPASCVVGPYCTVGPNVVLGEGCELVSHVVLDGHMTFGKNNKVAVAENRAIAQSGCHSGQIGNN